jgi:hypothetical protein
LRHWRLRQSTFAGIALVILFERMGQ